jgi:hypothetical protein
MRQTRVPSIDRWELIGELVSFDNNVVMQMGSQGLSTQSTKRVRGICTENSPYLEEPIRYNLRSLSCFNNREIRLYKNNR